MEMSEHITFEFEGFKETINESFSQQIQVDIEDSYTASYSQIITTTCEEDPTGSGVGLWQWVVQSPDGTIKTYSKHWVCRQGAGKFNKSP